MNKASLSMAILGKFATGYFPDEILAPNLTGSSVRQVLKKKKKKNKQKKTNKKQTKQKTNKQKQKTKKKKIKN